MLSESKAMEAMRKQRLLSPKESLLLRLYFSETDETREPELYQDLIFDETRQSFLLLLARLAKRSGFVHAPEAIIPRLQGLLRYHSINTRMCLQPALALLDCLEEGAAAFSGNSAMYTCYDAEAPRIMGVADLWAKPDTSPQALNRAAEAGFQTKNSSSLAALLENGQGHVNLHKLLLLQGDPQVWERCVTASCCGRTVRVTDCGDTLILLLRDEFRRWCILPKAEANLKWYYDCACLLRHPTFPGWAAVVERTWELASEQTVCFMLELFDRSVPGWVPKEVLDALKPEAARQTHLLRALRYGAAEQAYEKTIRGAFPLRLVRWFPRMRAKYAYLRSGVAFSPPPENPVQLLRQHWSLKREK